LNPLIIALRGKGNSGKSTTIKALRRLLLEAGFQSTPELFNADTGDFVDCLIREKEIIGITSCGDTYDILYEMLSKLPQYNPSILMCACRTYGGTNLVLQNFSANIEFVEKEIALNERLHESTNQSDAERLFDIINRNLLII
jgi:hypothetical protein